MEASLLLMDHPDSGWPRPRLAWIAAKLRKRRQRASARTLRRKFFAVLHLTFREFVTATILSGATEGLSRPDGSVKDVWAHFGYKHSRGFTRLVAAHLGHPPGSFRPTA